MVSLFDSISFPFVLNASFLSNCNHFQVILILSYFAMEDSRIRLLGNSKLGNDAPFDEVTLRHVVVLISHFSPSVRKLIIIIDFIDILTSGTKQFTPGYRIIFATS